MLWELELNYFGFYKLQSEVKACFLSPKNYSGRDALQKSVSYFTETI